MKNCTGRRSLIFSTWFGMWASRIDRRGRIVPRPTWSFLCQCKMTKSSTPIITVDGKERMALENRDDQ
jgi:hypothetical protein